MWRFWLWFWAGQLIHLLKAANQGVSDPAHKVGGYKEFIKVYWPNIVVRTFLCMVAFELWVEKPEFLTFLLEKVGFTVTTIPLGKATSAIFGFFSDSLMDWVVSKIPGLQGALPADKG